MGIPSFCLKCACLHVHDNETPIKVPGVGKNGSGRDQKRPKEWTLDVTQRIPCLVVPLSYEVLTFRTPGAQLPDADLGALQVSRTRYEQDVRVPKAREACDPFQSPVMSYKWKSASIQTPDHVLTAKRYTSSSQPSTQKRSGEETSTLLHKGINCCKEVSSLSLAKYG